MRVVFWGTYDNEQPRTRILTRGLKDNGVEVVECHLNFWKGAGDKSNLLGTRILLVALKWIVAYPILLFKYLRLPAHDVVVLSYLGHIDALILWPYARLRKATIVWDPLVSLYDTIVEDRKLLKAGGFFATVLYWAERLAFKIPDVILVDTHEYQKYFESTLGVPATKLRRVLVGAETDIFKPTTETSDTRSSHKGNPFTVTFFGRYSPMHGIDTIIKAAKLTENDEIRWRLIGRGQLKAEMHDLAQTMRVPNLEWIEWVTYEDLSNVIREANICLGIFGVTGKAGRVIPYKVYEVLAAGRPLITADTPAIHELVDASEGLYLIPPGDEKALADTVLELQKKPDDFFARDFHESIRDRITTKSVGSELKQVLETLADK